MPQLAAVQPDTAAKGQVVVQRGAVVPQAGSGVKDQQIVELRLRAGVGIQLGGAVCTEHPVGAAGRIVGKAGGALGRKVDLHLFGIPGTGLRQAGLFGLRQQGGQSGNGRAVLGSAGRGGSAAAVVAQCAGKVQAAQHGSDLRAAGMPQRRTAPDIIAGKGVAAHFQRVHGPQVIIIQIVAGKLPCTPLDGQYFLPAEQPPVKILPKGHWADGWHG